MFCFCLDRTYSSDLDRSAKIKSVFYCSVLDSNRIEPETPIRCPPTWDGWQCWEDGGSPDSVEYRACPSYIYFHTGTANDGGQLMQNTCGSKLSLSFCLSVSFAVCLSVCLSVCFWMSVCLIVYFLSVCLPVCLSLCLPVCRLFVFLSFCQSVFLFFFLELRK